MFLNQKFKVLNPDAAEPHWSETRPVEIPYSVKNISIICKYRGLRYRKLCSAAGLSYEQFDKFQNDMRLRFDLDDIRALGRVLNAVFYIGQKGPLVKFDPVAVSKIWSQTRSEIGYNQMAKRIGITPESVKRAYNQIVNENRFNQIEIKYSSRLSRVRYF